MYRVLIPVDRNERRARSRAQFVESLPNASEAAEAYVLFVFGGPESDAVPDDAEGIRRSVDRVGSVRRVRDHPADHGVDVTLLGDSGDAAERIVSEAERRGVDAIVLGGRTRPLVSETVLGSTTQSVLRTTDVPVVVAGDASESQ